MSALLAPTDPVGCALDPVGCVGEAASNAAGSALVSGWEGVCKSFADAAVSLLDTFAKAFVGFPNVDLQSTGVQKVYGLSLGLAGLVAVLLLLWQTIRTVLTHNGAPLAHAVVGLGKAVIAFMVTLVIAGTALVAADGITLFIVNYTFGNAEGLRTKLTTMFQANLTNAPSLLLMLALIAMLLTLVLWFELLLRNAAVAVLIATSPIAAAGMVGESTKAWFAKTAQATLQLIVLKPVIALVFCIGFSMSGDTKSKDVGTLLTGMMVLLLAALAWPAIARFMTFAEARVGGGSGLAGLIGAGSNLLNGGGRGGAPAGVDPNQFSQAAEKRTMAAHTAAESAAGGGAKAGAAGAGATAATGGAAAAVFAAKAGLDAAQRGTNALVGKSEQMAGHAGMDGANPHANPAGYPRHAQPRWADRSRDDYEPGYQPQDSDGVVEPPPRQYIDPESPPAPRRQVGPVEYERDFGDQQ
ncbi:hypothetical protein [Pilimelia columellifera]|uniref:TrbL/VirB6 plasmid conjugal transfer protein n=1 Tax=Pilimelia columellifera subsp. columellifera TaxID=706583 RepID=A0ABN3NHI7_9ACTN